nr:uncharacterized mitochondrial protein AtMg00810-like [Tanacetum cinerariifolium]
MVPRSILMKSGLVSVNAVRQNFLRTTVMVNAARPINTAHPKTIVNGAKPMSYFPKPSYLIVKRHIQKKTTFKDSHINQRVNTVKGKVVNAARPNTVVNDARPKAVLNGVKGNKLADENHVLLRVPRQNNMHSVDLKNIIPKGVSTACYVQNKVLAVKPHNKTLYKLFHGRTPALSFMKPFGCPVTILNTIDHLVKFDGKSDEGFFVGYSLNSKAFRVFNSRTRIVDENFHVRFNENTPNIAGTKESTNASEARKEKEPAKDYILLPLWTIDPPFSEDPKSSQNDGFQPLNDAGKKVDEDLKRKNEDQDQEKDDNVNSTNKELTFFLRLQVKQKKGGIFISQDKYVAKILKEFGFNEVKTASIPMETQKPLFKDEDGEEVDVHMYRSMISSLMYLTSLRPDIMFAVCACARYQVNPKVSHLHAVKMVFRYLKGQPKLGLWYPKDSPFDLIAYTDSDYARASLDRKSTTGGCQFLGYRLISWQCKKQNVVANSTTKAEYVAVSSCCGQIDDEKAVTNGIGVNTSDSELILPGIRGDDSLVMATTTASSLEAEQGSDYISKTQAKAIHNEPSFPRTSSGGGTRCQETMGDTLAHTRYESVSKTSYDSLLTGVNTPQSDEDRLKHIELMKICTTLQKRVLNLEDELKWTKTAQQTKIDGLEKRVKKLEKKQRSRTHKLKRLYKVGLTARVIESSSDEETVLDKVDASRQGMIDEIDADEDISLIKEVVEVITTAKIIVKVATASTPVSVAATTINTAQPTEATKTSVEITTAPKDKIKDKGKAKMIKKPEMPKKRKVQERIDKGYAEKLQANIDEEERIAREKSQQKQEANEALINTWDDIQAKIDADAHLAQQLQEQEQNELTDAEKAKLFIEFIKKEKNYLQLKELRKRGTNHQPKLNKERSYMDTKLVVEGKEKREVEGSSKRAGEELKQKNAKK